MKFSRIQLETLSDGDRKIALETLSTNLSSRVLNASNFDREVESIIAQFQAGGHELYLFDTDGEWQLWCGDWSNSAKNRDKLIIHFDPTEGVEVTWSNPGAQE